MKTRKVWPDILRIISIFLVMYTHTGLNAMYLYTETTGFPHFVSFCLKALVQIGPMMFFMISGSLLLQKEEDLKTLFFHRILRIVAVIVVFSLFQRFYWAATSGALDQFSILGSLKDMYSVAVITQYWFLYAYLGMLIMLPFLRLIAKNIDEKGALYLLILVLVFKEIIPTFEIITDIGVLNISLAILDKAILWPLLGYCIEYPLASVFSVRRNRVIAYLTALILFLIDIVYTHHTYVNTGYCENIEGTWVALSLAVFVLVRRLSEGHEFKEGTKRLLNIASEGVFFVFLTEPQLRGLFEFVYTGLSPYITWFFATLIWLFVSVSVGMIVAFLLHLIPGVKKFV